MAHTTQHPLAGKTVRIRAGSTNLGDPNFGGSILVVKDWWDRVCGESWMCADGNPAAKMYRLRRGDNSLPNDDEVVYGHIGVLGHLVHVSELE